MEKVLKESKDGELTKTEKIQVIILLIFNTLISWVIFYLGWREKLPIKLRQVNRYLKNILLALLLIAFLGILVAVILVAINPARQMQGYR
jgi:hypothetical protein